VSVAVPDLLEPFHWLDARFESIDRRRARLLVVNIAGIVWCAPLIEFVAGAWDEFGKGQCLAWCPVCMIKSYELCWKIGSNR